MGSHRRLANTIWWAVSGASRLCLRTEKSDLLIVDTTLLPTPVMEPVPQPTTEERRRSDRVSQRVPGWVSGDDRSSRGQSVTVCDMSMHGVGFYDPANRYRVGARHWLVVNGGAMRLSTRVKIVSCREAEECGYYIGASFF